MKNTDEPTAPVIETPVIKDPSKSKVGIWGFIKKYSWVVVSILWGITIVYVVLQKENTHRREINMIETAYRVKLDMESNNMALLLKIKDSITGELIMQRQLNVDLASAKDLLLIKNNQLKNQIAQISTETITKIDSVFIYYTDTINSEFDSDKFIEIPRSFGITTDYYSITGEVRKNGILAVPSVRNFQTITIGESRQDGAFAFLKDKIPVIQIENKNPYTETISMENVIIVKKPPKWFETRAFQILSAFAGGFTVGLFAGK